MTVNDIAPAENGRTTPSAIAENTQATRLSVLVLNGPNLNRLGTREVGIYGRLTLATITGELEELGRQWGVDVECKQSNYEGELIEWIHTAVDKQQAVIINPGGLTHTSVALRDALAEVDAGVMEVHISNVHAREEFRHHSFVSPIAKGVIAGCGPIGYRLALEVLVHEHRAIGAR